MKKKEKANEKLSLGQKLWIDYEIFNKLQCREEPLEYGKKRKQIKEHPWSKENPKREMGKKLIIRRKNLQIKSFVSRSKDRETNIAKA